MGGLRKYMPKTYATFMIGTARPRRHPPLAGFWSKDEILAGAQQRQRRRLHVHAGHGPHRRRSCTAAYMTRAIWYTFFGEYRGARPHAARVRPTASPCPLHHPGRRSPSSPASSTCPTRSRRPEALDAAVRALRRAHRRLLPGDVARTPSSTSWLAAASRTVVAVARHRPSPTSGTARARAPTALTERNTARPRRLHGPREQVLPRHPLHRRHRRRHQGPDRPGRLLVQPERHRRRRQRRRPPSAKHVGALRLHVHRPGRRRRRRERLRPRRRGLRPGSCASVQTGKVQQYAATCSSGRRRARPPSSSYRQSEERGVEPMKDLLNDWGAHRSPCSCPLVGAAVMMAHPEGGGGRCTRWSPWSPAWPSLAVGVGILGRLRLRPRRRRCSSCVDKTWIEVINSRYIVGIDGISLPLLAAHAVRSCRWCIIYSLEPLPRAAQPQGVPHPDPDPRDRA